MSAPWRLLVLWTLGQGGSSTGGYFASRDFCEATRATLARNIADKGGVVLSATCTLSSSPADAVLPPSPAAKG